ncbi:MAG: hypothetical protein HGA71_20675, partial [Azonexaceae bacterium]|nr:hypothetical protein [Azonexaceae bacterium]
MQGFAISLAIGNITSLFTALFVSHLIFDFGPDVLAQAIRVLGNTSFGGGDGAVSFGSTGAAGGNGANLEDRGGYGFSIDSSGRIISVGYSKNATGNYDLAIWRYNSDGTPDTTFGGDGAVNYGFP